MATSNGICITATDDPKYWAPRLKELNVTTVRMWGPSISKNANVSNWFKTYVKPWTDAGFMTIVCLTPPENKPNPSLSEATTYFKNVAKAAAGVPCLIEIWNEPNLKQYNSNADSGNWAEEVVSVVKAARQNLPNHQIIGPAVTWGTVAVVKQKFADLLEAGLLDHVDFVGLHPYATTAQTIIDQVNTVLKMAAEERLIITEWNIKGGNWNSQIATAFKAISPVVHAACYYRLTQKASGSGTEMNAVFPFKADGSKAEAFETVKAAMMSFTSQPVPQPLPQASKQKISGVVYRDTNGNGKRENAEVLAGVTVRVLDQSGRELCTKVTDQYGYYMTDLLAPGQYMIQYGDSITVTIGDKPVKIDLKAKP